MCDGYPFFLNSFSKVHLIEMTIGTQIGYRTAAAKRILPILSKGLTSERDELAEARDDERPEEEPDEYDELPEE